MSATEDIVDVLRAVAVMSDQMTPEEMTALLNSAADVIETLRELVGIADEVRGDEDAFQDNRPPAERK